jgi:hypothetical protein
MKVFIMFLFACFVLGLLPRLKMKTRVWILAGMSAAACVAYYFFNQV